MIPKRVVLDTNVCLDLFVFRDPRWTALHEALCTGAIEAVTRDDCRTEWQLVLHYPHLKLDETRREQVAREFDALIRPHHCADEQMETVALPICKDKDDQKFLELARDAQAALLLTKDKALLKLAGKARRNGLFAIMTPDAWTRDFNLSKIETQSP
jgi:putative PIN family toxin of toxin-antitoxin system